MESKAALAAIERFEAAARRSLISAEHRLIKTAGATAPVLLSALARRFDLSVLMQSEPNRVDNDDLIETTLLESGRPLIVVPYIQKSYVADVSGTLIVMGGYGHAKLREMILGGVTRGMLQSMTVPVFMSH